MTNRRLTKTQSMVRLIALLALCGCGPLPEPEVPDPPGPGADEPETCTGLCNREAALHCEEALPTARGGTCVEVCEHVAAHGIDLVPAAACMNAAPTCDALRNCE